MSIIFNLNNKHFFFLLLVRKQKLPELQIVNYGITHVGADISIPKHLMDKANKIHGNFLVHKTLGAKEIQRL